MNKRINAMVHEGMSSTEAADEIGIPVEDYVAHGNGYAVVVYHEPKPAKKAKKASKANAEAPTAAPLKVSRYASLNSKNASTKSLTSSQRRLQMDPRPPANAEASRKKVEGPKWSLLHLLQIGQASRADEAQRRSRSEGLEESGEATDAGKTPIGSVR